MKRLSMKNCNSAEQEYVNNNGSKCPVCGSKDLFFGSYSCGDGKVIQTLGCISCESDWEDVYQLTGYANLKKPVKYEHTLSIAFSVKHQDQKDYRKIAPEEVRSALLHRLNSLSDEELMNEALELHETEEE